MKNFAFQNRVLQRDRVLERRILEREYCMLNKELKLWGSVQTSSTTVEDTSYLLIHDFIYNIIHDFIYKGSFTYDVITEGEGGFPNDDD